jgi:hypothetical protein
MNALPRNDISADAFLAKDRRPEGRINPHLKVFPWVMTGLFEFVGADPSDAPKVA